MSGPTGSRLGPESSEAPSEQDLPPLADWPPPEILARWEARRRDRERARLLRRRTAGLAGLVLLVVAGLVALAHGSGRGSAPPRAGSAAKPGLVALSVDLGLQRVVAVVAVPAKLPPAIVAIPGETMVDATGGGAIGVGEGSASDGLMVAVVQSALDRRVDHYAATDALGLSNLVDSLGGIDVQTEAQFSFGNRLIGPGRARLTGGAAVAYLQEALPDDLTGRWEEVLAGVFASKGSTGWSRWSVRSDDLGAVRSLLARAAGAPVLELPTAPSEDGGATVDQQAAADLTDQVFGPADEALIRVVVLDGTGGDGSVGATIAGMLAPSGFRVVAEQQATASNVAQTQVAAASEDLAPQADRVRSLLGVGMVYVDPQPTGVADITIVVGKDFQAG